MDAAVQKSPHPVGGADPTRAGRIVVVRHGRPSLDREAGPRLDWRAYRDWWATYEACSLAGGQSPPDALKQHAGGDAVFFSSVRPRAMQTAAMIAGDKPVTTNALFNEAPLPPPRWSDRRKYLPKTWNKIARLAWMMGHAGGEESARDTRRRAADAAKVLADAAADGRDVVLAAHGWFNRMLRPQLVRLGWTCVRDGGDSYWSFRVYEKR